MDEEFHFDLKAKRPHISDSDLIDALKSAAEKFGYTYFTTTQYMGLQMSHPHSGTIIDRFGSWKKALALIGIAGGRERTYSPEQLIDNLEKIWRSLGYPPGKRKLKTLGEGISERPYINHWGSVRNACEALEAFKKGHITKEQLLARNSDVPTRTTIPMKARWEVLKRDKYRCVGCGASPSNDHNVELEVDHINPVARGGGNDIENLQTLCRKCNQGKKDR